MTSLPHIVTVDGLPVAAFRRRIDAEQFQRLCCYDARDALGEEGRMDVRIRVETVSERMNERAA